MTDAPRIVGFYGFKGGAGRSFLLANVAALLVAQGRDVLVIDADLEAPGLGDFLDADGGMLSSDWRLRRGFVDLVLSARDRAEKRETDFESPEAALEEISAFYAEELRSEADHDDLQLGFTRGKSRYLSDVPLKGREEGEGRKGPGRIRLLGPGTHRVSWRDGSFRFINESLTVDWMTLVRERYSKAPGTVLLRGLGAALREVFGDHVILVDGRTGYNQASLNLMQALATDVVIVGNPSFQSMDGIARMRAYFEGPGGEAEIRTHLVLSKTDPVPLSSTQPYRQDSSSVKLKLNELYHPGKTCHELPFIEEFAGGDAILFRRGGVYEYLEAAAGRTDDGPEWAQAQRIGGFLNELGRILRAATGEDLDAPDGETGKAHAWPTTAEGWDVDPRCFARAFQVWESATEPIHSIQRDFEDRARLRVSAEDRLRECRDAIDRVTDPDAAKDRPPSRAAKQRMTAPDATADGASSDTPARDPRADAVEALRAVFRTLTLEERALIRAEVARDLERGALQVDGNALSQLYRTLRLGVLPNATTRRQVDALQAAMRGRPVQRPAPTTPDAGASETGAAAGRRGADDTPDGAPPIPRDPTQAERATVADWCRALVTGDETDELRSSLQSAVRESALSEVAAALLAAVDTDWNGATRLLLALFRRGAPVLPRAEELGRYHLFDVARTCASKTEVPEARDLMSAVISRLVALLADPATADADRETALREAGLTLSAWVQIVPSREPVDMRHVSLPGKRDLQPLWDVTRDIGSAADRRLEGAAIEAGWDDARKFAFALRCQALALEAQLAIEMDDPGAATACIERAESLLPTATKLCACNQGGGVALHHLPVALRDLATWAAELELNDASWRLLRSTVVGRKTGVPMSGLFEQMTVAAVELGLVPDEEVFGAALGLGGGRTAENGKAPNAWWLAVSHFKVGAYRKALELLDPSAFQGSAVPPESLSWLVGTLAALGEGDPFEVFNEWERNHGWSQLVRTSHVATWANLHRLLAEAAIATGDRAGAEKLIERVLRSQPGTLGGRMTARTRVSLALMREEIDADLTGRPRTEEVVALLDEAVRIEAVSAAPTDRDFAEQVGQVWDGLGAFSGIDSPSPRRAKLATDLVRGASLLPAASAEPWLDRAERLLWLTGEGGVPSFLDRIRLALALPRAQLEIARSRHGLPANMARATAAMMEDIEANGEGRRRHYPPELSEGA
ncbi:MAG: hypothetical protein V2I65_12865 [Paracoccaceae bacterium]|jgi:hypothetical protein|nr:hypothetical protein [Paracoccaceae bacterium]